jgi:hypothetical protein
MSIDPDVGAQRVTAGVDWAKDDHAVCIVSGQGEALERFTVAHDAAGLTVFVIPPGQVKNLRDPP